MCFCLLQGDTVENVSEELECIMKTGYFELIITPTDTSLMDTNLDSGCKMILYYEPIKELFDRKFRKRGASESTSSDVSMVSSPPPPPSPYFQKQASYLPETWNREQIDDFVRKLGFLETQKADQSEKPVAEAQKPEQRVKAFQQLNQVCVVCMHCVCVCMSVYEFLDTYVCSCVIIALCYHKTSFYTVIIGLCCYAMM